MEANTLLSDSAIASALEKIATLEIGPNEALDFARSQCDAPNISPEQMYETFRSAVWLLLAFREQGEDMAPWYDVLRQIAALYLAAKDTQTHDRFRVLADLAFHSYRFNDVHADIATRAHVAKILQIIADRGHGTTSCAELAAATKIRSLNITRITNSMAACGLIKKRGYGQQALLSLP